MIKDILDHNKTTVSFEFFPPKTEKGWNNLFGAIKELNELKPAYVSVTYGAGGSTRDRTHQLVARLKKETDLEIVSHLTCVGSTKDEIATILDDYDELGVTNILALRGDLPEGVTEFNPDGKGFDYAVDLVRFIRERKPHFGIGVAGFPEGHPDTNNRLHEIDYLKQKVDAGANYIVSQLFFDNRDFYDYRDRCRLAGIDIPMVAGIMPITSKSSFLRMADLSPRTRYPAALIRAIERAKDDEAIRNVGIHWATVQILDLIDKGVPGIHLYTLNASASSVEICHNLGLTDWAVLQ